jgi:hypothetical protein
VAKPIFDGNTTPKKMYPQKWPLYDGHSMKAVKQIDIHGGLIQGEVSLILCTDIEICHIGRTDAEACRVL